MALIAEWLAENEPALYYGEHGGYGDAILDAVRRRDDQIAELQADRQDGRDNADLTAQSGRMPGAPHRPTPTAWRCASHSSRQRSTPTATAMAPTDRGG